MFYIAVFVVFVAAVVAIPCMAVARCIVCVQPQPQQQAAKHATKMLTEVPIVTCPPSIYHSHLHNSRQQHSIKQAIVLK